MWKIEELKDFMNSLTVLPDTYIMQIENAIDFCAMDEGAELISLAKAWLQPFLLYAFWSGDFEELERELES